MMALSVRCYLLLGFHVCARGSSADRMQIEHTVPLCPCVFAAEPGSFLCVLCCTCACVYGVVAFPCQLRAMGNCRTVCGAARGAPCLYVCGALLRSILCVLVLVKYTISYALTVFVWV